ncbi:MAG: MarR family winged helix-turn-helix transcriptional regulator [Solirubrobacteraceae bacterium]
MARLARQVERALAAADLTLPQYRTLIMLADGNEAASALADKLAVSRPSVTAVVDGLVARGLVQRDQDVGDRRRVALAITPRGRALLAVADEHAERRLGEIAEHGAGDQALAFDGLALWKQALDRHRIARRAQPEPERSRA